MPPYISIVPLGTGNDLARVLGWGSGYVGEEDIGELLSAVETADVVPLDRLVIVLVFSHVAIRTTHIYSTL